MSPKRAENPPLAQQTGTLIIPEITVCQNHSEAGHPAEMHGRMTAWKDRHLDPETAIRFDSGLGHKNKNSER